MFYIFFSIKVKKGSDFLSICLFYLVVLFGYAHPSRVMVAINDAVGLVENSLVEPPSS